MTYVLKSKVLFALRKVSSERVLGSLAIVALLSLPIIHKAY